MGLLNLFFGVGFNSKLWYFILSLIITIILIVLDRFLFGILPNFFIGVSALISLFYFVLWIGGNFLRNLWSTNIGKGIIFGVSFILFAIILTTSFSKQKTVITKVGQSINPTKIGKKIKNIR